ncbi:MAG: diguanylate cyclase [Bradyrhizobiaceae bacterium]|nr:MAG: diguanylate cyclase [Bradyrhizobiaceae bacterium]
MSIMTLRGNRPKFGNLIGIRARFVILALILVTPLMLDRVRVLENTRTRQIAAAGDELAELARRAASAQREVILAVEGVLKSSAYIYSAAADPDQGCTILRASMRPDLPWIRTLMITDKDGKIVCSTLPSIIGLDLSDREYFRRAMATSTFVVSDYIFTRTTNMPAIMAAYPATNFMSGKKVVIAATIDLSWMSQILAGRTERPGVSVLLVDGDGVVLAAHPENTLLVGQRLRETPLLDAVAAKEINLDSDEGSIVYKTADGEKQAVTFARVGGTRARMIVSTNEAKLLADIDGRIRTAYLQFAAVILLALSGAWFVGERLIIRPVKTMTDMAERFGRGDLSPPASNLGLPREFVPLLDAFNRMAGQLAERERELIASNNRLTVMASLDMISGLANRRGFQSRLDFEWLKAEQNGSELSLIMIDVDYFKLFNDTYGHPEGDACLGKIGDVLSTVAAQTQGFAARYGGEEFCVLVPGAESAKILEIADMIRASVQRLAIPHTMSGFGMVTISAGVAAIRPSDAIGPQELIDAADVSLYAAKRRGRNNIVSHTLIRSGDSDLSMAS